MCPQIEWQACVSPRMLWFRFWAPYHTYSNQPKPCCHTTKHRYCWNSTNYHKYCCCLAKHTPCFFQPSTNPVVVQSRTDPVVVIPPSETPQDGPSFATDHSVLSTQKKSSFSPELNSMGKARKIEEGVCMLDTLESLHCEFDTTTSLVPKSAWKPVSPLINFATGISASNLWRSTSSCLQPKQVM